MLTSSFWNVNWTSSTTGLEALCKAQILNIMNDLPKMASKMTPDFYLVCRRLSPRDGYQPNASHIWSSIETITEKGIKTSDREEEFDLIVYATGFDNTFIPSWKLVGLKGDTLEERWKVDPEAFFSTG